MAGAIEFLVIGVPSPRNSVIVVPLTVKHRYLSI